MDKILHYIQVLFIFKPYRTLNICDNLEMLFFQHHNGVWYVIVVIPTFSFTSGVQNYNLYLNGFFEVQALVVVQGTKIIHFFNTSVN